jgi:hypothetical protein
LAGLALETITEIAPAVVVNAENASDTNVSRNLSDHRPETISESSVVSA